MTKLAKTTLLVAAVITGFSAQQVRGGAFPAVIDNGSNPFPQFQNQRSETGPDGNNRFIWDYSLLPAIPPVPYFGSVLWIIDATGNFVAAGNVAIPASVGSDNYDFLPGSHIALHVSANNNTTLAFAFLDSTNTFVQSFATWTFNAQGILIAASGPFSFNLLGLQNIEFQGDFLVVRWLPSAQLTTGAGPLAQYGQGPYSIWILDEFGTIVSAAGPFGPFNQTLLGQVTLPPSSSGPPNQLWHWVFHTSTSPFQFGLNTWTVNPSGAIIAATSLGPF